MILKKIISLEVEDHKIIQTTLLNEESRLKDSMDLGKGVVLSPLFTTIKSQKAVGSIEILSFMLSFPVGIATGIAANLLYDWLKKNKVSRTRIEKTEIIITEEKETSIKIIIESLEEEN